MKTLITIILSLLLTYAYGQNMLDRYQYWFNADFAGAHTDAVAPSATAIISKSVSAVHLPWGLHTFHFRVRDTAGVWSPVESHFFYKAPEVLNNLAQNTVNSYQFWFNADFAGAQTTAVAPGATAVVSKSVAAAHLPWGLHTFHFRARDAAGLWSPVESHFFYKAPEVMSNLAQNTVNSYQFWFNADFAGAQTTVVAPGASVVISKSVAAEHLPWGLHTFHFRAKDAAGMWSPVESHFFYKAPEVMNNLAQNTVNSYQFWFNADFAGAQTTTVAPGASVVISKSVAAEHLPWGLHTFHFRAKDAAGMWSPVESHFFYKAPEVMNNLAQNTVNSYQFWFNADFAGAQTTTVAPGASVVVSKSVAAEHLPWGLHTFHFRAKDAAGMWSPVESHFFYKAPQTANLADNKIKSYRYWFGDRVNEATVVVLPVPVNPLMLQLNPDMRRLPAGVYTIFYQFQDMANVWSAPVGREFTKSLVPYARFSASTTTVCGNQAVRFTNQSVDADTWLWTFGDGATSTEFAPQHRFARPGDYTVKLTASRTGIATAHTDSLNIRVHPVFQIDETHTICKGQVFVWMGQELSVAGVYNRMFQTTFGCDSLRVLTLNVFAVDTAVTLTGRTLAAQAQNAAFRWINCDTMTEIPGQTAPTLTPTISGRYAVTVTQNGCTATSGCREVLIPTFVSPHPSESGITVFPNPTRDVIHIRFDREPLEAVISVYGIGGNRVYVNEKFSGLRHQILVADWKPGIYVITVKHQNFIQRFKLIKK